MNLLSNIRDHVTSENVNPWCLFKTSEAILAFNISTKITETFSKIASLDLNMVSENDRNILLTLSDNSVPFEWRKIWHGSKVASEFLKSVIVRIHTALKFINSLDDEMDEVDFGKIFNVDSFLSTVKLVTSRSLKVSTSNLKMESFLDDSQYERMQKNQYKLIKVAPLMIDGLAYYENKLVVNDGYNSNNMSKHIYIYFKEAINETLLNEKSRMCKVPMYSNYLREKLLCTIIMNTSLNESDIIYSGTALIVPMN